MADEEDNSAEAQWARLERSAWENFTGSKAKKKGALPKKRIRDFFGALDNTAKDQLGGLLPQYHSLPAYAESNFEFPDISQQDEVDAYQTNVDARTVTLADEIAIFDGIIGIKGNKDFGFVPTADHLQEQRRVRVVERNRLRADLERLRNEIQERKDQRAKERLLRQNEKTKHPLAPRKTAPGGGPRILMSPDEAPERRQATHGAPEDGTPAGEPAREDMDDLPADHGAFAKANEELDAEQDRKRRGNLGRGWHEAVFLGGGEYGEAYLNVKMNSYGVIVDRVVIKYTDYRGATPTGRPFLWNPEKTIPNEILAMCSLRPLIGSESIVKLRNWRGNNQELKYKLMMEWCPWGSVGDVLDYYWDPQATYRRYFIDESVVWHIFETLVTAGLLMERADLEPGGGMPGWKMIVHHDIKPPNVFVGLNTSNTFRGFKSIKLGDFGLALMAAGEDTLTSDTALSAYIYHAPETRADYLEGASDNPQRTTRKTNVWEIGNFMYAILAANQLGDVNMDNREDEQREFFQTRRDPTPFGPPEVEHYSEPLRQLVLDCMEYLPENRISLDQAMKRIRQNARDLRHAPANDPRFLERGLILGREKWQLASLLSDEPENRTTPPSPPSPRSPKDDGDSDDDDLGGDPKETLEVDEAQFGRRARQREQVIEERSGAPSPQAGGAPSERPSAPRGRKRGNAANVRSQEAGAPNPEDRSRSKGKRKAGETHEETLEGGAKRRRVRSSIDDNYDD